MTRLKEQPVVRTERNQGSSAEPPVGQSQSQSHLQQVTVDNQTIFNAEKILKRRKTQRKESIFSQMARLPEKPVHIGSRRKHFGQAFDRKL